MVGCLLLFVLVKQSSNIQKQIVSERFLLVDVLVYRMCPCKLRVCYVGWTILTK